MGFPEIRGFLAFFAVVAVIAWLWVRLDDAPVAKTLAVAATTTSTTIGPQSTTTTTPEQAVALVCDRATTLRSDVEALGEDPHDAIETRLVSEFWADVLPDLPADVRTEAEAVVSYYANYLAVTEPFDHDPVRIIIEGDKEKYEQLVTRPAPGLETARGFVAFVCDIEVPDKPWMSAGGFSDLEERLLDPDPLER